jgi:hypothetical protein
MRNVWRVRAGRANVRGPAGLEALETRVMLSAAPILELAASGGGAGQQIHAAAAGKYDLVPSFSGGPKLTGALVAGQAINGAITVKITNAGNAASPAGRPITAVLKPAAGGANLSVLAKGATVGALAAKGSTTVTLSLALPKTLKAETYSLIVTADPGNKIGEPNNAATAPFKITLAAGFVSLSATVAGSTAPTTISAGTASKAGAINVGVTNLGNISTAQLPAVNIAVSLRPTKGGADVPLFHQNNVKLPTLLAATNGKANGRDTLMVDVPAIPAVQTALLPAGSYKIIVTITPATTALKVPAVAVIGPAVTVTGKTTSGSSILKHGDTVTFIADTQLSGTNFLEMGSFTTNTGASGSYRFTPAGLTLTYGGGGTDAGVFTFAGSQVFLDPVLNGVGQKVVFSTSSGGAFMSGTVNGKTVYAKYG